MLRSPKHGTLTVLAGPLKGAVHRLDGEELVIGREVQGPLRVDDPALSRRHARFVARGGTFFVEDLDSKNGTFVDDERLDGRHVLGDGERIVIGQTVIKFALMDDLEREATVQLYEWTLRDPLTGLYNRRYFDDRLQHEMAFVRRHHRRVSLLMLDIDHFKDVNDTHGHRAGDLVLSCLGGFIQRILRTEDVAARYGGEELAVIVRDVPHDDAMLLATRICNYVRLLEVPWEGQPLRVTVSIGVATKGPDTIGMGSDELVDGADAALYRAKEAGRDRVAD